MKYRFIRDHTHEFPVEKMCQALHVSRGGYYACRDRPPCKRETENKKLLERIKDIYKESHRIYGSPRITDSLHDEGFNVSRPRVARLMRKNNIRSKTHSRFKVTTDSDHKYPISPNLLKQDFSANHFGEIWVSDITYIRTREGWLYLTVVKVIPIKVNRNFQRAFALS